MSGRFWTACNAFGVMSHATVVLVISQLDGMEVYLPTANYQLGWAANFCRPWDMTSTSPGGTYE